MDGAVVGTLMRLNYVGRRTAVAMVVIGLIAAAISWAGTSPAQNPVKDNLQSCISGSSDRLAEASGKFPYSKKNVRPGVAPDDYIAAYTFAFVSLALQCIKDACKHDVRECRKVKEWEDAVTAWRSKLPIVN